MNILKVGMVQQSCTDDIDANIVKLKDNIRKCASMGAQLVVLQELHNSAYMRMPLCVIWRSRCRDRRPRRSAPLPRNSA